MSVDTSGNTFLYSPQTFSFTATSLKQLLFLFLLSLLYVIHFPSLSEELKISHQVFDLCYKTQQQFNQTQNKQHSITAAAVMLTGYGVERERNNRSEQSVGLTELSILSPSDITNL